MKRFADLHIHTCMSDGSDTAAEVLELAAGNNVPVISITDHNTLAAYSDELPGEAAGRGLRLIPGVELDVIHKAKQYHLLAYGIDLRDGRLREACAHNANVQEAYNLELLRCMQRDGLAVSEDGYGRYSIPPGRGGWKLLNYLLDCGMTKSLLEGTKYYGQYGFRSNDIDFISLEEAVKVVKGAGGVPVLAHPGEQIAYNQYEAGHADFWAALEDLLQVPIEGIECIHPLHGFGMQRELIALCEERGLFISGGTDYHGQFFNKQKQTIGGQLIGADIVGRMLERLGA